MDAAPAPGKGLHFLYLFAGPRTDPGSLHAELNALGATLDRYDTTINKDMDLCDDTVWLPIRKAIVAGHYHGAILAPPCTSFSCARRRDGKDDHGPESLRGEFAPDIYGYKHLVGKDKEDARIGTLLVLRAAEVGDLFLELPSPSGAPWPWTLENPARRPGCASAFKLPELIKQRKDSRIDIIKKVQCHNGAEWKKTTEFQGTMTLPDVADTCMHPRLNWTVPWSGEKLKLSHPPLRGTQRAIPSHQWTATMLRRQMPYGDFLTKAAAAYPSGLNKALAQELVQKACSAKLGQNHVPEDPRPAVRHESSPSRVKGTPMRASQALGQRVGGKCGPPNDGATTNSVTTGPWRNTLVSNELHTKWYPQHKITAMRHRLQQLKQTRSQLATNGNRLLAEPGHIREFRANMVHMNTSTTPTTQQTWSSGTDNAERITWTNPLRGTPAPSPKEIKKAEDDECIAGMRNSHRAVSRIPGWYIVGSRLRTVMDNFLDQHPDAQTQALAAVSGPTDKRPQGVSTQFLDKFRMLLSQEFGGCATTPVCGNECDTNIRADLLGAIANAAGDPGQFAVDWLRYGAPAGILKDCSAAASIFPLQIEPGGGEGITDDLARDDIDFVNDKNIDTDPAAGEELNAFADKGYLLRHNSLRDCSAKLKGRAVISKFRLLKRMRAGKIKMRIILDLKESQITFHSGKTCRVVLPRGTDHIRNLLDEMAVLYDPDALELRAIPADVNTVEPTTDSDLEQLVLDFSEAFWQVPLDPDERRFFVGKWRDTILSYRRAAQGSRNGPLAWASVCSLAVRTVQSMYRVSLLSLTNIHAATLVERREAASAKLQTYVDDPAVTIRGTKDQRDRTVATIVILWAALGFGLSYDKASRGRTISWIGLTITIGDAWVRATIKADRVKELLDMTNDFLSRNVISVKEMRSYVGKASNFAQLLFTWRPFLGELWASFSSDAMKASGAPLNCIWRRQVLSALRWLKSFLQREAGAIVRIFTLEAHLGTGQKIQIASDASPWGFGAVLIIDDVPVEYYSEQLSKDDLETFQLSTADPAGQQIWEALAVLVSMRMWSLHWRRSKAVLEVRSDNVTALTLLTKMSATGAGLTLIAREMALDIGLSIYRPAVAAHAPGISHKIADALSRKFAPGFAYSLPKFLETAKEVSAPSRPATYYTTRCS